MAIRITDLRNGEGAYAALDDRMLVLDFQAGHPEAFVEIHGRYGGLVRHVCSRYLPNAADADEAFQETMIRVFQGLYRFNGQYALQPWIARIATNISLDIIRGRARRPTVDERSLEEHDREDQGERPDEAVERLVQRDLILNVLADMPDTHRRALVLREVEGLSHKEIGEHLEITPSQAKALIHRAKGTFRRRWLHAISERGGVMAFALAPAMWAMRAIGGARRVVDRVAQATITTEVVSSAASSASAGSVATFSGERLVAAATVTVLIAGGVTVGAATIGRNTGRDRPIERTVASAPPAIAPTIVTPSKDQPGRSDEPKRAVRPRWVGLVDPEPVAAPSVTPAPTPTETPSPSPEPPPSESPSPEPVVPVAPAWSFDAVSSTSSTEECDCGPGTQLTWGSVDVSPDGMTRLSYVVEGGALDAEGDVAWSFELDATGSVTGSEDTPDGTIEYRFSLTSPAGSLSYRGVGVLAEVTTAEDGNSTTYRFSGSYSLAEGETGAEGFPTLGEASLTVSVWNPTVSLIGGSASLFDAA